VRIGTSGPTENQLQPTLFIGGTAKALARTCIGGANVLRTEASASNWRAHRSRVGDFFGRVSEGRCPAVPRPILAMRLGRGSGSPKACLSWPMMWNCTNRRDKARRSGPDFTSTGGIRGAWNEFNGGPASTEAPLHRPHTRAPHRVVDWPPRLKTTLPIRRASGHSRTKSPPGTFAGRLPLAKSVAAPSSRRFRHETRGRERLSELLVPPGQCVRSIRFEKRGPQGFCGSCHRNRKILQLCRRGRNPPIPPCSTPHQPITVFRRRYNVEARAHPQLAASGLHVMKLMFLMIVASCQSHAHDRPRSHPRRIVHRPCRAWSNSGTVANIRRQSLVSSEAGRNH